MAEVGITFDPEQAIKIVAKTSSRTGATILLINAKPSLEKRSPRNVATEPSSSAAEIDWNVSAELWHPAKRRFMNAALKFDE